jgi:carbamoyl-phosphate synthase large subunit
MVNCNPETVSTDYDTSDRLYFEPLTLEDVLPSSRSRSRDGVIVQYGGQTPLKLAMALARAGVPILGSAADDRSRRGSRAVRGAADQALAQASAGRHRARHAGGVRDRRAHRVPRGRPPELRARGARDGDGATRARISRSTSPSRSRPSSDAEKQTILVDQFLKDAIEVDVDAISRRQDGRDRRSACSTSRRPACTRATASHGAARALAAA